MNYLIRVMGFSGLILLSGCGSDIYEAQVKAAGPGYWFFIILVVLPLGVLIYKLFTDLGELKESLLGIEGQLRRLISRVEELEGRSSEEVSLDKSDQEE
jgi:hypothetical protein